MIKNNFEHELIDALQPIRSFVLSTSIFHLFNSGIYDLISNDATDVEKLVDDLGYDQNKMHGFFAYLKNENIVEIENGKVVLTYLGRSYSDYRAWYVMMIGGYGETFLGIGDKFKKNSGGVSRDIVHVGVGSCGISYYDAFPLTHKLIENMKNKPKMICDLGCGNGMYLVEFCNFFDGIKAIGIEPNESSCVAAREFIKEKGRSTDIEIICDNAVHFLKNENGKEPDLYIIGFVLHEILGQEGEEAVIQFLVSIRKRDPETYIAIIEVDDQIEDPAIMKHGLSQGYYNPYYLLHYFTNQKLEKGLFWENVFEKAGFDVIAKETTLDNVDSTGLELGYLIKGKE